MPIQTDEERAFSRKTRRPMPIVGENRNPPEPEIPIEDEDDDGD